MSRTVRTILRSLFPALALVGAWMGSAWISQSSQSSKPGASLVRGADLVLFNGKIWTGEMALQADARRSSGPRVEAVAIANGRFLTGGTNDEMKAFVAPNTQVIDLK